MDAMSDRDGLGDIPLYLTPSTKSVETAPNRIAIGAIQLRAWQIHRLVPTPPELAGRAAYLVRTNYEFDLEADAPELAWAEVEFGFVGEAVIVDAVPRNVTDPAAPGMYALTPQLHFVQRNGESHGWPAGSPATTIAMPAITPQIDCFGLGGDLVKWRHTGKVLPGSHTGCFVLVVPATWEEVQVIANGRHHIELDPDLRLRPASRDDAFRVRLPPSPTDQTGTPTLTDTRSRPRGTEARVFISYAHESEAHKAAVRSLYELLRNNGLDVRFDQEGLHERRLWEIWTTRQILRADFVLVIASPSYRQAGDGTLPKGTRLGLRSEYRRLVDVQHRDPDTWLKKILPVVLPGRSPEEIPLSFTPGVADHYVVDSITQQGAADLLRVLLHEDADA
ncbi:toll/interleukin-1 receptor domain-containing protein [Streptomyces sp. NPDC058682]|uniref:toll/interleukin-1 receptor domain-containing protein n=1 Tax=unclassified Streptomyces TaxID=2593676 RepID=UPI002255D5D1|nr:toll/interleukin-1 receptor domain-containing protein [Streptomyces sp. NBC_01214]MCX4804339.1 toll/interleukin-1 receptor domain-containing protein [Streptomyces sp. NBC_01214]